MSIEILKYADEKGNESTLLVDLVSDLTTTRTAELTELPIEDGSLINDHRIVRPVTLSCSMKMVTKPVSDPAWTEQGIDLDVRAVQTRVTSPFLLVGRGVRAVLAGAGSLLGLGGGSSENRATVRRNGTPGNRQQDVYETLIRILDYGYVCSVTYDGRIYPNLSMVSLTKIKPTGPNVMQFQVDFRTLRTVTTTGAALPDPADLRAKPAKKKGAKPADEKTPEVKKSLAAWTTDALTGAE